LAFRRHAQVEFRLPVSGGPSASKLPPEKRVGRAWGHGAAVSRAEYDRQCLSHGGASMWIMYNLVAVLGADCWICFCLTSVNNRTMRRRGRSHPVSLGIGSAEPIRDCLDREANLSLLGSALSLQCLQIRGLTAGLI